MNQVTTAFVLVSHDRRFLDNVCTRVMELAGRDARANSVRDTQPDYRRCGFLTDTSRTRSGQRLRRVATGATEAVPSP